MGDRERELETAEGVVYGVACNVVRTEIDRNGAFHSVSVAVCRRSHRLNDGVSVDLDAFLDGGVHWKPQRLHQPDV